MLKQLVTLVQDSCASINKCAAKMLVNITGDEAGANAMLIISESSNSTEKNMSSKQNISCVSTDSITLASVISVLSFYVSCQ